MKYALWLKIAAIMQLITGFVHGVGMFFSATPANETERHLLDLMTSYKMEAGFGFHPSMDELFLAVSGCFSLVCFLGGLLNWYLLRKSVSADVMRGVISINLLIFAVCFGLMLTFTFLPPIVLTGLIFFSLIGARGAIAKEAQA